jgi:hypothetical protein
LTPTRPLDLNLTYLAGEAQWGTTAWNAAWIAADACQQALKDISHGKHGRGYLKADGTTT